MEYVRANSTRSGRFYRQTPTAHPPTPLKLASIQHTGPNSVALLASYISNPIPSFDNLDWAPTTLSVARSQLDPADRWAVKDLQSTDDGVNLASLIATDSAIAVSDGSYNPDKEFSTSAFVITSREEGPANTIQPISGLNSVPRHCTDQNL